VEFEKAENFFIKKYNEGQLMFFFNFKTKGHIKNGNINCKLEPEKNDWSPERTFLFLFYFLLIIFLGG